MNSWLLAIGGLVSAAYIAALCVLFGGRIPEELLFMPLNEVGDFLAGAFGPLAILWLILGFFQQGYELRQNSEVLRQQAKELGFAVQQHEHQVAISRKQLEEERERARKAALPNIVAQPVGMTDSGRTVEYIANFSNVGNTCTSISFVIESSYGISCSPQRRPVWLNGDVANLRLLLLSVLHLHTTGVLVVSFYDAVGVPGSQTFDFYVQAQEGSRYPSIVFEARRDEA